MKKIHLRSESPERDMYKLLCQVRVLAAVDVIERISKGHPWQCLHHVHTLPCEDRAVCEAQRVIDRALRDRLRYELSRPFLVESAGYALIVRAWQRLWEQDHHHLPEPFPWGIDDHLNEWDYEAIAEHVENLPLVDDATPLILVRDVPELLLQCNDEDVRHVLIAESERRHHL